MAGRKTKFNKVIAEQLCTARENGLPANKCAEFVGVHRNTLHNWLKRGEKAKSGQYHDFYIKWNKAESKFILYHLKKINDSEDWRASQYLLSVTDPDSFNTHNWYNIKADVKQETTLTDLFDTDKMRKILNEETGTGTDNE